MTKRMCCKSDMPILHVTCFCHAPLISHISRIFSRQLEQESLPPSHMWCEASLWNSWCWTHQMTHLRSWPMQVCRKWVSEPFNMVQLKSNQFYWQANTLCNSNLSHIDALRRRRECQYSYTHTGFNNELCHVGMGNTFKDAPNNMFFLSIHVYYFIKKNTAILLV